MFFLVGKSTFRRVVVPASDEHACARCEQFPVTLHHIYALVHVLFVPMFSFGDRYETSCPRCGASIPAAAPRSSRRSQKPWMHSFGFLLPLFAALGFPVALGLMGVLLSFGPEASSAGSRSNPKNDPAVLAFRAADALINSAESGVAHGNTAESERRAAAFSAALAQRVAGAFTGGKRTLFDRTRGQFLTYCNLSADADAVLFLVQVPMFKRYKGDVRDELIRMAWDVAVDVTDDIAQQTVEPLRIGVGLRGDAVYGGLALGHHGHAPDIENLYLIDKTKLEAFFRPKERPLAESSRADP